MHTGLSDLLATIGGFGLPGAPTAGPVTVAPETWEDLTFHLRRRRLSGLAVAATVAGVLDLTDDQRDSLAAIDRQTQTLTVRAERRALELTTDLARSGIPSIVLKGPVTARRGYDHLAWRPFFDVDVLVRGEDLDDAVGWLEGVGAERLAPQLRLGFDRRFAKSVTLRRPDRVEVDLHRTLVVGPLGQLVPVDDLWQGHQGVEVVPGRVVGALHDDVAFVHACLHTVAGGALGTLPARDVLGLAPRADLGRCADLARRWRATAVVQAAVAEVAVAHALPLPADLADWARSLAPDAIEQRILRTYRPRPDARRLAAASLRYVPGLRGKVAYAAALVLPSAANRSARRRTLRGHAGRVLGMGRRGHR